MIEMKKAYKNCGKCSLLQNQNRKRISVLLLILCICSGVFTGCGQQQGTGGMSIEEECPQDGFMTSSGSQMVETPEGFYAFQGNFLYYITPDLQKSTILCGKPECTHNADASYAYAAADCNAFFADPQVAYYDGSLYIAATNFSAESTDLPMAVYQVSMDGSEKKLLFEGGQFIHGLCIYKGDLYIADTVYESSGKKDRIHKISLQDSTHMELLFETTDYPDGTLNRFTCYGDSCYFFFTPGGAEDNVYRHLKVNLETGESTVLFESDNDLAILRVNDYGCIIEDQDVNRKNEHGDWLWDSSYYKIAPGDTKAVPLTKDDLPLLAENPWLYAMDDTYLYFATMSHPSWSEESWPEDASIYVCNYAGEVAAALPIPDEFHDKIFYVLPGTDDYMFVQLFDHNETGRMDRYFYAPKAEFGDGAVVQLKEIPME